ncbi:hypothetical protein F383_15818 [Gossypium arboreum]|uniref:Uncharacterized protein n=1 Tax=Gossypium arboreum TaxID=29729 RepID=A0A0B0Q0V8_GOSAR|nr:hypothetical protein F383_15818 [Gossypium arboreum]
MSGYPTTGRTYMTSTRIHILIITKFLVTCHIVS